VGEFALVVLTALVVLLVSSLVLERWTPYTRTRIQPGMHYRVGDVEHQVAPDVEIQGTAYLLKPEVLKDVADLVRITDEVLESQGIPYVTSHGTLLGAVRHQGVIPFDDDGDAYILDQSAFVDRLDEVRGEFEARGAFLWQKDGDTYFKVSKVGSWLNFPVMDLYEYHGKFEDESNLYPLARLPFEDFEVNVPCRYLHCLDLLYRKRPDDDPLRVIKAPFLGRYINNLTGNTLHFLGLVRLTRLTKGIERLFGLNEGNQT
jgi:hypothetical protein